MKKGDYSVHILVEKVKSLPQLNKKHLRYPVVKLTVFNKSKRTEKTKLHCEQLYFWWKYENDNKNIRNVNKEEDKKV